MSLRIIIINSYGKLFDNYRPKITGQILNTKLKKADREAIKDLALGSLTRDTMSKCDNRVLSYCIECSKNPKIKYKQSETVQHFLKCHVHWKQLHQIALTISNLMQSSIDKKLKSYKLSRALNQCNKFKTTTFYNDAIDVMLGIGKVQVFASIAKKKKWSEIKDLIFRIQEFIIIILKDKNRLGETYYDRLEKLLQDQ